MRIPRRQVIAALGSAGSLGLAGCLLPNADEEPPDQPEQDDPEPSNGDGEDGTDGEDEPDEEEPTDTGIDLNARLDRILAELAWLEDEYAPAIDAYRSAHRAVMEQLDTLQATDPVTPADIEALTATVDTYEQTLETRLAPYSHIANDIGYRGWLAEVRRYAEIDDQPRVQENLNKLEGTLAAVSVTRLQRRGYLLAEPATSRLVTVEDASTGLLKSQTLADRIRPSNRPFSRPRPLFELRYQGAVTGARFARSRRAAETVGKPPLRGEPAGKVFVDPVVAPTESPEPDDAIPVEAAFGPVSMAADRTQELYLVVNEFLTADAPRFDGVLQYQPLLLPATTVYIQRYTDTAAAETAVETLRAGPVRTPAPVYELPIGERDWTGITYETDVGVLYAGLLQVGRTVAVVDPSREPIRDRRAEDTARELDWRDRLGWTFLTDP